MESSSSKFELCKLGELIMNNNILLFSGGLDSLIAYFYLNKPKVIFVNMRQKYAETELERVKKLDKEIGMDLIYESNIFDFHKIEQEDLTIPYRNMFLSMLASLYGSNIWMAAVNGDFNHDKTPEIFLKMSTFMTDLSGKRINIRSPFWNMTKSEMVKWYLMKGYPEKWLKISYSCFKGSNIHCGRCSSCLRRWVAMTNNGLKEEYQEDPLSWNRIPQYIDRFLYNTNPHDTQKRKEEFIEAMFRVHYPIKETNIEWVEKLRSSII